MQNQGASFAANSDLLTGDPLSESSVSVSALSGLTEYIDAAESADLNPVAASVSVTASSDGDFAVTSAAARAGDVLLANAMPEAEYMYGCTPTALAMLLGYYDLYGNDDLGYANLIEGDVDVNSRDSGDGKYDMDAFDTVLGRFIASPEYVERFFGTVTVETTPEEELPYTFVNGGSDSGLSEVNVSLWDCLSDYLGTSQYWRGNNNYGTSLYYSTDPGVELTLASILAEPGTVTVSSGSVSRELDWRYTSMLYGLNLYVETRGYTLDEAVTGNYRVDTNGGSFTFEDYMAEIDAGRPVLIGITGHSMVGYGYNASTRQIIFDDTYFSGQTMTWGGTYYYADEYRELLMITVIHLEGGELTYPVGKIISEAYTEAVATPLNVQVTATGSIVCDGAYALQFTENDHALYLSGGSISGSNDGSGAAVMFGTDIELSSGNLNNYKGMVIFNGSHVSLGFTVEGNGGATVAAVVAARTLDVSFKGSAVGSAAIAISLSGSNKSLLYADAFRAAQTLAFSGNFSGTIDVSTVYSNIDLGPLTTRSSALYAGTDMTIEDTFAGTVSVSTRVDSTDDETMTACGLFAEGGITSTGRLNGNWTIGATGGMASSTVEAYGISAATVQIANMGAAMNVSASGSSARAYGVYGGTSVVVTGYAGNLLIGAEGADDSGTACGIYSAGTVTGTFGGRIVANGTGDSLAIAAVGALNIAVTGTLFSGYYENTSELTALLADPFTNRRALTAAADGRNAISGGADSSVTLTGSAAVFGGISFTGTGSSLTLSGNASVYGDITSAEDLALTISLTGTSFNHSFITTDSTADFPSITVDVSDAAIGTYQLINSADLTVSSITISGDFGNQSLSTGQSIELDNRIYALSSSGSTLRLTVSKVPGSDPTPEVGPLTVPDVPIISVENGVAVFTWKAAEGTREALGYRLVIDDNYYFSAQTSYTLALTAGTYTVAVQALDDKGAWGAWTSSRILIVGDTENPLFSGLPYAAVDGSSVTIEWGAGTDNSGVEGYLLRIGDEEYTVYDTVYSLLKCGAGVHTYSVRAFDAAGNLSGWTEEQTFEVADVTAPEFGSLPRVGISAGVVTIGWDAASDDVAVAGYVLELNGVELNVGLNISYSFDGEPGEYAYRVKAYDDEENFVWTESGAFTYSEEMTEADTTELLSGQIEEDAPETTFAVSLEPGRYRLQGAFDELNAKIRIVDANGKTVYSTTVRNGALPDKGILLDGDYTIVVTGKTPGDFSLTLLGDTFDRGNNADDNYKTMSADDYQVAVGDSPAALVSGEWVGYSDKIDYRGLLLENDGKYTFSFTATDAAKLTVWTVKEDGSLKALKSVSVKAGQTKGFSGLLLDSQLCYLSVESTNAAKGGSADYSVTLTSDSVFFTKGDNGDDTPLGTGELIVIDESLQNPIVEGWVGYGDAIDYNSAIFVNDGKYTFSFTATDAAKVTIWVQNGDCSLKRVKSVSVKAGQTKGISGLLLDGGIYYLSVISVADTLRQATSSE